jgi:hypothetical protein
MGYDPFAPDATGVPIGAVRVVIARSARGPGLTGTYTYANAEGVEQWTRTYTEPSTIREACKGVMKGIAVEVTGEFQVIEMKLAEEPPPSPAPRAPEPPPAPAPAPAPQALTPTPPQPAPPPATPRLLRFEAGAGVLVALNLAPSTAFGGFAHAGVHFFPFGRDDAWMSVALEGRADAATTGELDRKQSVTASFLGSSLIACGHRDLRAEGRLIPSVFACVTGTLGSVHLTHVGEGDASGRSAYGGIGPRFGVDVRIASLVTLRLHAAGLGTVHAASALRGDRTLWTTPTFSGDVGLAALFFFGSSGR